MVLLQKIYLLLYFSAYAFSEEIFVVVVVAIPLIFSFFFHFLDQTSDLSVSSFQVRWPFIATVHLAWRSVFSACMPFQTHLV